MPWRHAKADFLRLGRLRPEARRTARLLQIWVGFMFVWAFLAGLFQAPGLIGPDGILPAGDYLHAVRQSFGLGHGLAFAPSLFWLSSGTLALHLVLGAGLLAAILVMLGWHPRWATAVCLLCFLSFLSTAQAFASYQSDGMLMSAGLIALCLDTDAPAAWPLFSFRWLWFLIYFGSGVAKIASGDPEWRHLTALDHYYENGPLPTWIGWYAQQWLPHHVEAVIAGAILAVELGLAWFAFLPRRYRIICFWIVTPMQIAIILTANYGFLNYLVLGLGLALVDDRHLAFLLGPLRRARKRDRSAAAAPPDAATPSSCPATVAGSAILVLWIAITAADLAQRVWPRFPAPQAVTAALAPFRIADPFGLFATMTRARYEIEFQGSDDGQHWTAYPFRYKPQDPAAAPGIYAPYQPRFDWNLWFASLGSCQDNPWVEQTELRLLDNDGSVLALFQSNPFAAHAPRAVRAVVWQYWFSTPAQKRAQGVWWTRRLLGLYCPEVVMTPAGAQLLTPP